MNIKGSIITNLKEENKVLQVKVEKLEKKLADNEMSFNRLDLLKIHDIPSEAGCEVLEDKKIDIFQLLDIPLEKQGIKDCQRLGKSSSQNASI